MDKEVSLSVCPEATFQKLDTECWEFVTILTICFSDLYRMEPKAVVYTIIFTDLPILINVK